jgi:hypothetical protein
VNPLVPLAGLAGLVALLLASAREPAKGSGKHAGGDPEPEPDPDPEREPEGGSDPAPSTYPDEAPDFVNLMGVSPPEKRHGTRSDVWSIVLHQMGFSRGNDPSRYRKVTAHFIITPDGTIAQLHPVDAYLYSSNGLNAGSVAVEFAGNLPSRSRSTDPKRFWSPGTHGMDQLTGAQVAAGRLLIQTLRDNVFPARGWELRNVLAHRQAHGGKGNDPGPDVWGNVAGWAVNELGMGWGGPDFSVDTGLPIPQAWWDADWYGKGIA